MEINFDGINVIGFDADDTLWVNETYFRDTEDKFANLLEKDRNQEFRFIWLWYKRVYAFND